MKAGTICCYCISKCMIKKALQNHCMRTQIELDELQVRWAYFREKYHNSRKYANPLFQEPLKFIAHGHTSKWLQYIVSLFMQTLFSLPSSPTFPQATKAH